MIAEQRRRSCVTLHSSAQLYSRRHGSRRSCCWVNNQRCRAVTQILCCLRNFLLTANARFQFPRQSVMAPCWAEGCYYCKQRPCCFIWLSEGCRENPDLRSSIHQKWGIQSFSNEKLLPVWFNLKDYQKDCRCENVTKAQCCFNRGEEPANH